MKPRSASLRGVVRLSHILIPGLVPIVLLLTNVRLLLTPTFVQVEYSTPGFPADPYGFSRDDRLRWSRPALEFVLNRAEPAFLGDLRFDDGSPAFNPRELSHMVDVQRLVQQAMVVWVASLAALALALAAVWRLEGRRALRSQLRRGGLATLIAMGTLIVILALSFSALFVGFHRVFFDTGTWVFFRSDTLIRLFPERFWRDAFGALLLLTLAEAGVLVVLARGRSQASA